MQEGDEVVLTYRLESLFYKDRVTIRYCMVAGDH